MAISSTTFAGSASSATTAGEQLHQWIADGRVHANTQARVEGAAGWQSLSEIPEFAAAFAASTPPPLSPAMSAATPAAPSKTSGLAVTSLILGILGVFTCGITALFGLVLGIIAMVKVKNSGGKLKGNGLALAGTIVSGILLFLIPLMILPAMLLPALAQAKQKAQEISCVNNVKQLALAIRIYSGDNNDKFPPAATWCDAIKTTAGSERIFKCPAANSSSRCDYAFNAKLDGMDQSKVNPQTVMIFESDTGWNANGGSELMIGKPRHARMFVVAFADGSVQQLSQSRLNTLRWDP